MIEWTIQRGDRVRITDALGGERAYEVMAIVDGWAMLRRPQGDPFCHRLRDLRLAQDGPGRAPRRVLGMRGRARREASSSA